jgi:hypothetical protein
VRNRLIEKQKLRNPRHELLFVGVFHLGGSTTKKKQKTLSSVPESSITFFFCVLRIFGGGVLITGWRGGNGAMTKEARSGKIELDILGSSKSPDKTLWLH